MNKMVVFLGNPGTHYARTRHNTAWMFCSRLGIEDGRQQKFRGEFVKRGNLVFLKPLTFMNESGLSVREAASFFRLAPENILVVHDDIELDFGTVNLRLGGGCAGHNGLKSIKKFLGTESFYRLRLGIGRPKGQEEVSSFVLSPFTEEEKPELSGIFSSAKTELNTFCGISV